MMPIYSMHIELAPGTLIYDAIDLALELVKKYDCVVTFEFNGAHMVVREGDTKEQLLEMYKLLAC